MACITSRTRELKTGVHLIFCSRYKELASHYSILTTSEKLNGLKSQKLFLERDRYGADHSPEIGEIGEYRELWLTRADSLAEITMGASKGGLRG